MQTLYTVVADSGLRNGTSLSLFVDTEGDLPPGIPYGQPCPTELPVPVTATTTLSPSSTSTTSPPQASPVSTTTTTTAAASSSSTLQPGDDDKWERTIQTYLREGCSSKSNGGGGEVGDSFCAQYLGAASYCKAWQRDDCDRSACQGGQFLLPCLPPVPSPSPVPPASTPTSTPDAPKTETPEGDGDYELHGCSSSGVCHVKFSSSSYCKTWSKDECDRSVCQGGQHSDLVPCP